MLRLVDAGRIYEDHLTRLRRMDTLYLVPCRLWLVGHDGHLLPEDLIHESGFADVRPSDDAYESRFEFTGISSSQSSFMTWRQVPQGLVSTFVFIFNGVIFMDQVVFFILTPSHMP